MASISNAGGSLTSAVVLTLLAWGVRWVRSEIIKRKQEESSRQQAKGSPGRFYAELSPAALRLLVETGAQPHLVFDVRPLSVTEPLPSELRGALRLPAESVSDVVSSPNTWLERFQGISYPEPHYILVFVGDTLEQQYRASTAAAAQGFQRTMILKGTLHNFSRGTQAQPNLRFINRDALALLLGVGTDTPPPVKATVIDVRRSDERALFGAIKGTVAIPVDQLPSALSMSPDKFAEQYRFPKPRPGDLIITSCRTRTRAAWAAQLVQDAGLHRCLVYKQGVYGWRLDPSVKVYHGYALLDPPPEPEPFQVEELDIQTGAYELDGLLASTFA